MRQMPGEGRDNAMDRALGVEKLRDPAARRFLARAIALLADALQIFIFPAFFSGFLSPLNDALDLTVGIILVALLGWHIAFLPTFVTELVPGADLFPTWTVAVLYVTRRRRS